MRDKAASRDCRGTGWAVGVGALAKAFKNLPVNFLAAPASCCQNSKRLESFRGVRTNIVPLGKGTI